MSQDERTYDEGSAMATEDEAPASSIPPDEQTALATSSEPGTGDREPVDSTLGASEDRSVVDQVDESALLPADQNERFRSRWEEIQASFVDEPQKAVEEADALVADLAQRVTASLTKERERLEGQWAAGDDVSTEDLRVALTRYRTFFDRLLAA